MYKKLKRKTKLQIHKSFIVVVLVLVPFLCGCKEIEQILGELNDLSATQLGRAIDAIHECDGHLSNTEVMLAGAYQHFHLEDIPLGHTAGNTLLQHWFLVEPKGAGQVAGIGTQQHLREKVSAARY